jgi:hypothetical protein
MPPMTKKLTRKPSYFRESGNPPRNHRRERQRWRWAAEQVQKGFRQIHADQKFAKKISLFFCCTRFSDV